LIPDDVKIELLSEAKAVVAPLNGDYRETFGLYILEAMASGTPVFVTDMGAPAELLGGIGLTKYGYVSSDITNLEKAISNFVNGVYDFNSKSLRKRASEFINMMMEKYLKLIDELISR